MTFAPVPRLRGRVDYRRRGTNELWGFEDWSITRSRDGLRTFSAHCEMTFDGETTVRDSTLSVDAGFQPLDAYVRIARDGLWTGSGWFRFTDHEAECEGWSQDYSTLR